MLPVLRPHVGFEIWSIDKIDYFRISNFGYGIPDIRFGDLCPKYGLFPSLNKPSLHSYKSKRKVSVCIESIFEVLKTLDLFTE